jgi:hypothetical protein
MTWRCLRDNLRMLCIAASLAWSNIAFASEYHGQVIFNGLPLPGATVTAIQDGKRVAAISDQQGLYSFADLQNGKWTIVIEMLCFATIKQDVTIVPETPLAIWELKLLPLAEIMAKANAPRVPSKPVLSARSTAADKADVPKVSESGPDIPKPQDDSALHPSDGLLINGSSSNAATSQYALDRAFGNSRSGKSLYNGSLGLIFDNSATDARPYSLTGLNTPKGSYNRITGVVTFGGPLNIPHLMPHGPNLFLAYQWTRNRSDFVQAGLVPDAAERNGDFSNELDSLGQPTQIFNPETGQPFTGNIPISPQAQALLALYPLPNIANNTRYNYQTPVVSNTHQDALQSRFDKTLDRKDQVYGTFALQSIRTSGSDLFGFVDTTDTLGINTGVNWAHRFNQRFYQTVGYHFSRLRIQVVPNFQNRQNISSLAGITGNDQDPENWGPPMLTFSSGIASLSDAQSSFNRNRTDALSYSATWNHRSHNVTVGGDFRKQQFNVFSQQDPRGTFTFTGAVTQGTVDGTRVGGSAFADFLLGRPDTSSIAFGNADKYLRQSVYDAFVTDDWRLLPTLTLNVGIRWEYGAPISELQNRLVNLDISSGFAAVAPVLASNPTGSLTDERYPHSLIRPDHLGIEPRIGLSWRPIAGSTLVVRAGYGVYDDTSVYQATALQLAQQSPLSKSLSVQNSAECPLSLENGFIPCSTITSNTFAVDPNFRVGYAQAWQLSAQRDLPAALVGTITYAGIKGTRGVQEYLPNTYPIGAANPCPACPAGFVYRTSNGDSTRESVQAQLRRRLRSGFTATAQYTYSKSIDDDSTLGGQGPVAAGAASQPQPPSVIAQNWLNLKAERALSTFDQRNLLNLQLQYTSGMGLHGGSLLGGWTGTLLKDWTALGTLVAGSGLPETPIYLAAVPGTGFTGSIRPSFTGASVYAAPLGHHLNPAAFSAPATGAWGDAGRDSIIGPDQLTFNASLARTLRLKDRFSLDLRVDSTNLLNHVVFTTWNTIVNVTTFGLPAAANPMRSLQTTIRLRY